MLLRGTPPETAKHALEEWMGRGLHPKVLTSIAEGIELGGQGTRTARNGGRVRGPAETARAAMAEGFSAEDYQRVFGEEAR